MQTRGIGFLKSPVAGLAIAAALILGGCSKAGDDMAASTSAKSGNGIADKVSEFSQAPMHYAARQPGGERSVLRSANLDVDVDNLDKAEKAMKESVTLHGGYIDHEEGSNLASETPVLRLTIRVPEKSFETVLSGFESLGHRTQKTISASDLTEEILSAEARLKQARESAPPNRVSALSDGPSQIKQLQDARDQLAAKAAMATIDLTLQQKPGGAGSVAATSGWGSDTWNAALSSAMGAFRVIGAVVLWVVAFSPIWGLALFGAYWVHRAAKRPTRVIPN